VALLAFGADSFVELLFAGVALFSFIPSFPLTKDAAARMAGILLYVLAVVVACTAVISLTRGVQPEASCSGIAITIAALVVMPLLAWFKRKLGRSTGNRALGADAVQSATCAYLAAITLAGLALNAIFHIRWIDSVAALAVLPILVIEGRNAMRGEACGCH
jgi:divalent metal cation (Fe/Co/Zn/Cd) transporter